MLSFFGRNPSLRILDVGNSSSSYVLTVEWVERKRRTCLGYEEPGGRGLCAFVVTIDIGEGSRGRAMLFSCWNLCIKKTYLAQNAMFSPWPQSSLLGPVEVLVLPLMASVRTGKGKGWKKHVSREVLPLTPACLALGWACQSSDSHAHMCTTHFLSCPSCLIPFKF